MGMASESAVFSPIRRWLRSDMRVLRWVFLALYLLIIGGLLALFVLNGLDSLQAGLWLLGPLFLAQGLFILGSGTVNLCQPIRRRRLWLPLLAAGAMLGVLVLGLGLALCELFYWDKSDGAGWIVVGIALASWLGWGVLLWAYVRRRRLNRMQTLGRLGAICFAGSLAELLACIPAHILVSRRPGCLVGLLTMLGIIAGIYGMLFAFGPMILVLFLRPRYRQEQMEAAEPLCPACGYDLRGTLMAGRTVCPECGAGVPGPEAR